MKLSISPHVGLGVLFFLLVFSSLSAQENTPSSQEIDEQIMFFFSADTQHQESARTLLLQWGKITHPHLKRILPSATEEQTKRVEELLEEIEWGQGEKEMQQIYKKQTQQISPNDESVPTFSKLVDEPLLRLFPHFRFYTIERNSNYYKPGQSWHGSIFALKQFEPHPQKLYTVGQDMAEQLLLQLLTIAKTEKISLTSESQVLEFFNLERTLYRNSRPDTPPQIQKVKNGWIVKTDFSSVPPIHLELNEQQQLENFLLQ